MPPHKLALVTSHPVQYYAPWFRKIAADPEIDLKVFYLWQPAAGGSIDPEFQKIIQWDIPLLDGYDYEWIPNTSSRPGTDHFNGLKNPTAVQTIRKWNPDAILCLGYLYHTFFQLMFSRSLAATPFLIRGDSHRLHSSHSLPQTLKDTALRVLFRRFSAALYCGQANQTYFRKLGIPSKKLHFCPHGIDTLRFTPVTPQSPVSSFRTQWNIPDNHHLILFAGKFIDKKRPLDLLHAFRDLAPPNTSLVFVGDGPLKPTLENEKTPDIIIQPFINQVRMPEVYHAADLLVLPSFGTSETWGLAVQEALACGTPAIVSNHCGCHSDLILPDQNGMVFPAGDTQALQQCLAHALLPGTLERWQQHTLRVLDTYNYDTAVTGLRRAISL